MAQILHDVKMPYQSLILKEQCIKLTAISSRYGPLAPLLTRWIGRWSRLSSLKKKCSNNEVGFIEVVEPHQIIWSKNVYKFDNVLIIVKFKVWAYIHLSQNISMVLACIYSYSIGIVGAHRIKPSAPRSEIWNLMCMVSL